MAVKMLTEYSAYDKVKKYKGKEIRYISKRRFKSLELKKEVRGFFSVRKAKTEQTIVCNDIPFDLRANRKCRRIVGYVKGEDGGFYAMTAPPLLPFIFLFLLLSFLLLFFLLSNISNQSVKEPWTPVIDSGIYDTLTEVNPFKSTVLPTGLCLQGKRRIFRFCWKIPKAIPVISLFQLCFRTARFSMNQNRSRPETVSVPLQSINRWMRASTRRSLLFIRMIPERVHR